ncbi:MULTISPECIES: nuclear transport factor 2 family protein [Hyphobacterium]|uniref:Nuclear transport factor 2 family protein n=1 Tax=Hyphobacterium vulgare TaxID=1736751 RepID=A0ABV6ZXC8_9PROT
MIRTLTAAAALAAIGGSALAQETQEAVAEAYLAAYQAQDFAALEALYAEDAVFIDPTSEAIQGIGGPFDWTGREAILAGIRAWGATRLEYTVDRSWSASGHVVFDGAVAAIYETQTGTVAYRYPIVTIVTVGNGQVTEHRDYTDFSGMTQETR